MASHIKKSVITYPFHNLSYTMLAKGAQGMSNIIFLQEKQFWTAQLAQNDAPSTLN